MRKEKNKYVFAADAGRFKRSHRIRNTFLILIPLLILTFVISNITVSRRIRLEEMKLTILTKLAKILTRKGRMMTCPRRRR